MALPRLSILVFVWVGVGADSKRHDTQTKFREQADRF